MKQSRPPLLPSEVLRRMLRVARFNGSCVLALAGICAFVSASYHDVHGTTVSLLVAGAGAIELHGAGLLAHREERGLRWLVSAQVYLMFIMLAYVAYSLQHPDIAGFKRLLAAAASDYSLSTGDLRQAVLQSGMTVDEFLRSTYQLVYLLVGAATVIFQGAMGIYYARRQPAVAKALAR